jgi:hypothetical protein
MWKEVGGVKILGGGHAAWGRVAFSKSDRRVASCRVVPPMARHVGRVFRLRRRSGGNRPHDIANRLNMGCIGRSCAMRQDDWAQSFVEFGLARFLLSVPQSVTS